MSAALRAFLAEPRPADPPGPTRRDRVLLTVIVICAVVEALVRDDLPVPVVSVVVTVGLAPLLLWRHRRPLAVVAVVFGTIAVVDVVLVVLDEPVLEQTALLYVLLLPYALVRWGAGREIVAGLSLMLVPATLSTVVDWNGPAEPLGGFGVLVAVVALAFAVRTEQGARGRRIQQAKAEERVLLARELHDTVAHHVSAIAIQAQAGRALAATQPTAPLEALTVIEGEASRTLAQMRALVRVLREGDGEAAELTPHPGVADLPRLRTLPITGPRVEVCVTGDVATLPAAIDAAVYRIAQEAVTNALRHARNATVIDVRVAGEPTTVSLDVRDDGDPGGSASGAGFGLIGMAERAALLGGECEAGPGRDRGWSVRATLPRQVPA